MNQELEVQIALVCKITGKAREAIIEDACRGFCRSIAGGMDQSAKALVRGLGDDAAGKQARRAAKSPGSIEAQILAFLKQHGPCKPGVLFKHIKTCRPPAVRKRVALLEAGGMVTLSGKTAGRVISLV